MQVIKIDKEKTVLEISTNDLICLCNTLNEVCNGIEVLEFEKQMGITIEEAESMLDSLDSIYKKAERQKLFEE